MWVKDGWEAPVHRQSPMYCSPQCRLQPSQWRIASGPDKEAPMEPTDRSVTEFLTQIDDPKKRSDSKVLVDMMTRITGRKPKIWGRDIVGFGQYHYKYASGTEGDAPLAAFSPRK